MTESKVVQEEIPTAQRDTKQEDDDIAKINEEGRIIFDDFTARQKQDKMFRALDPQSKYEFYMKLHPEFARSAPVILRYITLGMFSEKANFLYFKQCYRFVTKTDEDFAERQADFVKYLYHCTTNIRGKKLDEIWRDTKTMLMKEINVIAAENEKIRAERLARQDENDVIRREAFKAAIIRAHTEAKARLAAEQVANKISELSVTAGAAPTTQADGVD